MDLVPGRACGTCDECCTWLPIVEPGIEKLSQVPCRHLVKGKGCGIYDGRPKICSAYHCAWRHLADLDDAWRPDRSGILVEFDSQDIPPGYEGPGLKFTILGDIQKLEWKPFLDYVSAMAVRNVPMFLQVPVYNEYNGSKAFINDCVKSGLAAKSDTALMLEISRAALACTTTREEKFDLEKAVAEVLRERGLP